MQNSVSSSTVIENISDNPQEHSNASIKLSRRGFLKISAAACGGMMFEIGCLELSEANAQSTGRSIDTKPVKLIIGVDNKITLIVPGGEMGQGINSALAQVLAEELPLDFGNLVTIPAPFGAQYASNNSGSQLTAGSQTLFKYFPLMIEAGALHAVNL